MLSAALNSFLVIFCIAIAIVQGLGLSNINRGRSVGTAARSLSHYTVATRPFTTTTLFAAVGDLDDVTKEKIESVIQKNKVVLFMKGNKLFPQWSVKKL
jgi:hypothetical protein